jgi:hypothetical protein
MLTRRVSYLPFTSTKKTINRIFSTGWFLRQHDACLLRHIHAHMCLNGDVASQCKNHRIENKLTEIFISY